ncbi:galanin receptor type 2-like [Diadema antillarum]|uniref:galanin receptor type 2-like n=1 Tax=Diadema antillarum TaxID=105358 RepID=UPI003A87A24E
MSASLTAVSAKPHFDEVWTETLTVPSQSGTDENTNVTSVGEQDPITWSWEVMTWSWYTLCELLIAVIGITGNVLVIAVVFGRRLKSRGKCRSMDIFVGNLAIADFLTSILLVPHPGVNSIPNSWTGALFCKAVEGKYLIWTTITASIYSLVSVSVDRFVAVVYPIHYKRFINSRLVNLIVGLIWVVSCVFMVQDLSNNTTGAIVGKCVYRRPPRNLQIFYGIHIFVVQFAIPTTLMLVTQIAIARSLRREAARFVTNVSAASFHNVARSRVITLTLTVVLIYFICFTPDQIAYMAFNLGLTPSYVRSPFARVLTALVTCNSCVNPIVYTLRHPQFREAVKDFFRNRSTRNTPIFEDLESHHRSDEIHPRIEKA